ARFRKLSHAFLAWNEGAVRRRRLTAGQVIAEEGEYGNTAFILEDARIGIFRREVPADLQLTLPEAPALWPRLQSRLAKTHGALVRVIEPLHAPQRIIGEMSPMTHERRTASMVAVSDGSILEIDRNGLSELLRV